MVHLLIPYVAIPDHPDPLLEEYSYGDVRSRATKLKRDVMKGDYVFFHTTTRGHHYITAYYVVDRIVDTHDVVQDKLLTDKYRNPHIAAFSRGGRPKEDVILFGDPILSKKLDKPLPFDRRLAEKLSLRIKFRQDRTDLSCIGSATRQWRELTNEDVQVIRDEISKHEKVSLVSEALLSTEEVQELRESDLEDLIANKPELLEPRLSLLERQYRVSATERIDLLFTDAKGDYVVVELKLGSVGRGVLTQIKRYIHEIRKTTRKQARGIIVCRDILPAFRQLYERSNVTTYYYGWRVGIVSSRPD